MALTKTELDWAYQQLEDRIASEGMDCADGLRVAEVGDSSEKSWFQNIKSAGCCGEYESILTHPETIKEIRIGCNYGH
jgi:hypothetical protein